MSSTKLASMRAHLRHLRHEIRTPINAIVGFGDMLMEECPEALRPLVVDDIGSLLATARSMTHALAEAINCIDADPHVEDRTIVDITHTVGDAVAPILAQCMSAVERIRAVVQCRESGESGEFGTDLFKIHGACHQLFSFLASVPTPQRPYETPGQVGDGGVSDPTGAFALAQQVQGNAAPSLSEDSDPKRSRVLVVDDNDSNRAILTRRLVRYGYGVIEAADAMAAMEHLQQGGIDLVLLDVLLPGMDGYQLCRAIKADPATVAIPVLLVTALHERQDRIAGIAAGANDFLTKPLDAQDLLLRCRNAVAAKRQHDRAVESYRQLKQMEDLRDRLTHLIVHDMRSPLTGLIGYLDLVLTRDNSGINQRSRTLIERAMNQGRALEGLINQVLEVSRLESGAMPLVRESVDLSLAVRRAIEAQGAAGLRVVLSIDADPSLSPSSCDPGLIGRVFGNLLSNAISHSHDGAEVRIRILRTVSGGARIEIADNGPGIAGEHHEMIFQKFSQVASGRRRSGASSGLGLAFCKLAVEAHGGRIGVVSTPGEGSLFWFELL